jgi:uncharacterized protein
MKRAPALPWPHSPRKFGRGAALFLICFPFLLAFASAASAQTQVPSKPAAYVNDYANVLTPAAKTQLEALCTEINDKAKAQIFVVTVKTTGDTPIEDFSINLATRWGVGPKASSSGVLILYAIDDRKSRIEVGYGLEGILNDGKVGSFMREAQTNLRAGDYSGGILLVTRRVADTIAQDRGITLTGGSLPAAASQPTSMEGSGIASLIVLGLIIFFLYLMMKNSGGGRSGRGGGSGWWIGPMIGGMMSGGGGGGWSGGGGGGGFRWRFRWRRRGLVRWRGRHG